MKVHKSVFCDLFSTPVEKPITEQELHKLARKVPNDKLDSVGFGLGFDNADINRYKATNVRGPVVTSEGTGAMLQDWYQRTSKHKCHDILREALIESGLTQLAEDFSVSLNILSK